MTEKELSNQVDSDRAHFPLHVDSKKQPTNHDSPNQTVVKNVCFFLLMWPTAFIIAIDRCKRSRFPSVIFLPPSEIIHGWLPYKKAILGRKFYEHKNPLSLTINESFAVLMTAELLRKVVVWLIDCLE